MRKSFHNLPFSVIAMALLANLPLAGCGVSSQETSFASDYRVRHPVIVSAYRGAYVPSSCGEWVHDAGANNPYNGENVPLYNHGCASQRNLAAMVANPHDLLEPRPMTPVDARRRYLTLDKWRQGQDPSTTHKIDDKNRAAGK